MENWPFFASASTRIHPRLSWIKYVLGKIEFKRLWAGKRERKRDSKCTLSKIAYTSGDTLWIATRISVLPPEGRNFPSRSNSYSYYLDTFVYRRARLSRKIHALDSNRANKSLSLVSSSRSKTKHVDFIHVNYSRKRKNSILEKFGEKGLTDRFCTLFDHRFSSPFSRVTTIHETKSRLRPSRRHWGLRLRLSTERGDRIVFRTIWLIERRPRWQRGDRGRSYAHPLHSCGNLNKNRA